MRERNFFFLWLVVLFGTVFVCGCGTDEKSTKPTTSTTDGLTNRSWPSAGRPNQNYDPKHPTILIETSLGNIVVRLDAENAPLTVENFLSYVESKHYDQTIFHQVQKDYVILGGSYTAEKLEKKTQTPVRNEAHNGLKNRRGSIAMARKPDAIDSATSQFFFNVNDNPQLDHISRTIQGYGYCVFGTVAEGIDVVDRISDVPVVDTKKFESIPAESVLIKSIRRVK